MKRVVALLSLALFAAPDRTALTTVERAIDQRIESLFDEPWLLLGTTRGVYLDGTGVVFTFETSLALGPSGPIVPRVGKEQTERLRQKRVERLPILKSSMEDMMVQAAGMMSALPSTERVVLGMTIFRKSAEDNTGIPAQIVMQAVKSDLLQKNKAAIKVQEF